jgi:hypothetical protein
MESFKETLVACNLSDLGAVGPFFTWHNGREGDSFIQERLDRVVASPEWCEMFQGVRIAVEVSFTSDHAPLFISLRESPMLKRNKNFFKYEAHWGLNKECKEIVKQVWRRKFVQDNNWQNFNQKVKQCKLHLRRWERSKNGNREQEIGRIKEEILSLQGAVGLPQRERIKQLQEEANSLLTQEDLHWQQRSKELWLKCGDKNTKYFHACATQRRRRNLIQKIQDMQGREMEFGEGVERAFVDYFTNLFQSDHTENIERCLQGLETKVTQEMNDALLMAFTVEEVQRALRQMAPMKAPGPDGLSAGFFIDNWATVGEDVCNNVLNVLNSGVMNVGLNFTHIALVPKIKAPVKVTDFRPISLCNVVYKLISKVLANRLKVWLPKIISPFQSAFIQGRLITDNIIAAYETLHTMHSKMYGKKGYMAVKLDMSKAYDRV